MGADVSYTRAMRLALAITFAGSVAVAAPPKQCDVSVQLDDPKDLAVVGKVTSIKRVTNTAVAHWAIKVADKSFDLYADKVPFKVGSTIDVHILRAGTFQVLYDAIIKDGAGTTLLVSSASGSTALADGWAVTMGAVVTSNQDPNQKERSVDQTMALDFARGKTRVTVKPYTCAEIKDGDATWLVSGVGHTWLGLRPPEGVDYQMFSIVRRTD